MIAKAITMKLFQLLKIQYVNFVTLLAKLAHLALYHLVAHVIQPFNLEIYQTIIASAKVITLIPLQQVKIQFANNVFKLV